MALISPLDAIFLLGETRRFPMHVAALQLYELPKEAGPNFVRLLEEKLLADQEFDPTFQKRTATALGVTWPVWKQESNVDLRCHVHRWAVPAPADQDALLELVSRLHSMVLDPRRPRWELHLIEGLAGRRFAIYSKAHHSLTDGVAGEHVAHRALSTDPSCADVIGPWHLPTPRPVAAFDDAEPGLLAVATARGSDMSSFRAVRTFLRDKQLKLPFQAPKTMLNVPAAGPRQCVIASYPMERVDRIRRATGTTVNDVILAITAGALRAYLLEHEALPDAPLVALVPVSLRTDDEEQSSGGNKVSAVLCPLGTDVPDVLERLHLISAAMKHSKSVHRNLSRKQATALGALLLSPLMVPMLRGIVARTAPPFNIIVSTMRGPSGQLYCDGARLAGSFPLSIPMDGQAVNITLTASVDTVDIGVVGYPLNAPRIDRLPGLLDDTITELEPATTAAVSLYNQPAHMKAGGE